MRFIVITLTIILALFLGYIWYYPTYRWHQKMTVEVEVDGKLYTGASVLMLSVKPIPGFLPINADSEFDERGEAVVLKLPQGQYLFASLWDIDPIYTSKVFRSRINMRVPGLRWARDISRLREKIDIPPKLYPLLVTFADINDPVSVQKVNPNDLAATFGKGVRLKRITLEITNEPVTKGEVEKVLGWLGTHYGRIKPTTKKYKSELTAEEKLYPFDFRSK